MNKKYYYGLETIALCVDAFEGILAASQVIEQNDLIKASSQDLADDVNFQDSGFNVTWE